MSTVPQNPAIEALVRERDSASAEIERLQADIKIARHKLRSFEDAIALLTGAPAARAEGATLKQLVLEQLSGSLGGMTPIEIANAITASGRETINTSVSPILSRLLKDGAVTKSGDRWRVVKNETAPDAIASEAVQELGPVGRERGYPPSAPEGSIPSGSTASRDLDDILRDDPPRRDLDSEIPF